jgi:hypothetical protein
MSMTRKEILDLRAQFQTQCDKIEKHQGYKVPHPVGLNTLDGELGKSNDAKPSLTLRKLGQLLKHYIEEMKKKPSAVIQFNVAAPMVARGEDVQQAIRKARNAVRESVIDTKPYVDGDTFNALRNDRHDRVLQAILET